MDTDEQGNLLTVGVTGSSFRWTVRRRKFVYHYPRVNGDAVEAARRAGFKDPYGGSRLLEVAEIKAAIEYELRHMLLKEGENEETIIGRWARWAQGNIYDYWIAEPDGRGGVGRMALKNPESLTEEQKLAVKKLKVKDTQYGQDIELELEDRSKANDRLAEVHGILSKDGNKGMTPDEYAQLIRSAVDQMDAIDALDETPPTSPNQVN